MPESLPRILKKLQNAAKNKNLVPYEIVAHKTEYRLDMVYNKNYFVEESRKFFIMEKCESIRTFSKVTISCRKKQEIVTLETKHIPLLNGKIHFIINLFIIWIYLSTE